MDVTAALVELGRAMASAEYEADPGGVLRAWVEVVTGEASPGDRWRPAELPTDRAALALALARERGAVRNGDLREALGLGEETVRRLLAALVREGRLARLGDKRGARYVLPDMLAGAG